MGEILIVLLIFGLLIFLVCRGGHGLGCCGGHFHKPGDESEDKTQKNTDEKSCH
jgi:hypothetical protein